jgi:cytosine/adenosine deaminase-related metal-dependent hydrolase
MKYFSAQYIFTNTCSPLKRAVICAEDDGTVISIEETAGKLSERHSVEFYNGIIVPGLVNCHCHLELSYLKNEIMKGIGLGNFLMTVSSIRDTLQRNVEQAIISADNEMLSEGIVLCADICNSSSTFNLKKESNIHYINLLEVFGIDSLKAQKRMNEILEIAGKAEEFNLPFWIIPHSVYSVSLPLFRLIRERSDSNKISSIHFMESADEKVFLNNRAGSIMESYRKFLPSVADLNVARDHVTAVREELTSSGNLLLVHNTYVERDQIKKLAHRNNIYWCLCPNSNLFIEQKLPPIEILSEEGCKIVIGTDGLSSNSHLSILGELKTIQREFPSFSLETLIIWATINGAKALGEDKWAGSIEPGKKPGLILIQDLDLKNLKLLPGSTVHRLI